MIGKNTIIVTAIMGLIILSVISLCYVLFIKTGLFEVPGSRALYHPPAPVHLVSSRMIRADEFQTLLATRVRTAVALHPRPPYIVSLSEEEITGALQGVIGQALRSDEWKAASSQVALTKDVFEVSGRFVAGKMRADVRFRFVPVVENGGIRLEPVDIRVGEYPIHPYLARRIAGALFQRDFGTWVLRFGDIQFQSAELRDRAIDFVITIQNP